MKRYASTVYAVVMCLFIHPSCLSHASVMSKRTILGSHKQCHAVAQDQELWFSSAKGLGKI